MFNFRLFVLSLRFLFPHMLTMMHLAYPHHALHVPDAPVSRVYRPNLNF